MYLYSVMARVFPNSFTAKVYAVAFVGTHVPLAVLALRALAQNGPLSAQSGVLAWALGATLAGTLATLLALRAVLRPIYRVEQAMRDFEQCGDIRPLPSGFRDELGRLMERTNRLVLHVDGRIGQSRREAETDPLTGVANRRGFERQLGPAPRGVVMLLDIDHFKRVNDTLGHDQGDAVLCDVARALTGALRRQDVLARFGGEEFVVHMPGVVLEAGLTGAERLRCAVERAVRADGRPVTVSAGVAQIGPDGLAAALTRADRGTYAAKRAGRNRVAVAGEAGEDGAEPVVHRRSARAAVSG